MKVQHNIKLVGVLADGSVAKTHQANDVVAFIGSYKATEFRIGGNTLSTNKGDYTLVKHPSLNLLTGVCNGTKVHVSLKKVVGELRTWF